MYQYVYCFHIKCIQEVHYINSSMQPSHNFFITRLISPSLYLLITRPFCAFTPNAHKEENDPGSHSLCIGSQADKEGKEE